ncbi:asparagine synthase-related protein [Spirosoma koreense]
MIRFDGQAIDPTDTNKIIDLLKHRGNPLSYSVEKGLLLAFGGTIEVNPTAPLVAAVDADMFVSRFSDYPFSQYYAQAGPAAFNEPNADFAVALWDAHQQTLYCARDVMGVKPLYYIYQPNRFFAFASEIKALTALHEVAAKPNRHKFREYLTWPTTYLAYSNETFHEGINSVLPGHYLRIGPQGLTEHAYWQVNFSKFDGLKGIGDYSALFNDCFTKAIDNRIKGKKSVGSQLSGGLDSSSVSCVAQSLLMQQHRPSLHTFNIDTEQPYAEEQAYVKAVVEQWHTDHHRVLPVPDVLDSILKIHHQFDQPEQFIIPSSFHLSVSLQAQQLGCDILLTGHDGDSVVTPGFDYLSDLAKADQWDDFKLAAEQFLAPRERNLQYISEDWPTLTQKARYEKYVLSVVGSSLKKQFKNRSLRDFFALARQQQQRFGLSESAIIAYVYKRISAKFGQLRAIDTALNEDFKRQVPPRLLHSTETLVNALSTENHVAFDEVLNNTNVVCTEQMNHIGAYYGHTYSFPFFDKDVIELGLATPMSVRFDQGRGRGLIRQGLRHVLPDTILSRVTKANFVEYGTVSVKQLYEVTREQLASTSHPIWEVVDRRVFMKLIDFVYSPHYPARRKTRFNWLLSRTIYLALWLDSFEKRH